MAEFYHYFACSKAYPLLDKKALALARAGTCSPCGGQNGQIVSQERFEEGQKAGVYCDLDPRTGKPSKKKRR